MSSSNIGTPFEQGRGNPDLFIQAAIVSDYINEKEGLTLVAG
jgi:hypothetical protein